MRLNKALSFNTNPTLRSDFCSATQVSRSLFAAIAVNVGLDEDVRLSMLVSICDRSSACPDVARLQSTAISAFPFQAERSNEDIAVGLTRRAVENESGTVVKRAG